MKKLATRAAVGLLLAWGLSGVMIVEAGQVAVVQRFGAIVRTLGSGLHLRMPFPLETDLRLNVTEVRRVAPEPRRLLTGDHNLIQLSLVVQYTVSDPVAFTVALSRPEEVIAPEVMSAAVRVAAGMEVDDLLTTGRSNLQLQVLAKAQQALDGLGAGVRLVAVDVQELTPPQPVVDAFNDVSSARGDRETLALSAEAYASKLIPDVRGQGAQSVEQARARGSVAVAEARGETERFKSLLDAWKAGPDAVQQDLEADLLREVSPHLDVIVAAPGAEILLNRP